MWPTLPLLPHATVPKTVTLCNNLSITVLQYCPTNVHTFSSHQLEKQNTYKKFTTSFTET